MTYVADAGVRGGCFFPQPLKSARLYIQLYFEKIAPMPDMQGFEWDEAKAEANLQKHAIDFVDAVAVFDGPMMVMASPRSGEARKLGLGLSWGHVVAVIYVERGDRIRIISARRARTYERAAWYDRYPQDQ